MPRLSSDRKKIASDAAEWVVRLRYEESDAAQAEFDTWVRQGPLYLDEFLRAQVALGEIDQMHSSLNFSPAEDRPTAEVIVFPSAHDSDEGPLSKFDLDAKRSASPVGKSSSPALLRREEDRLKGQARRRRWRPFALAASVAVALLCSLLFVVLPTGTDVYATAVGGQQTIKLKDGSIITLNTDSRVEVRFSDSLRSIHLVKGEALFTVAHNASRPFIVQTDRVSVRAIGTAFNVRTGQQTTRVAVVEGIVQVTRDSGMSTVVPPSLIQPTTSPPRGSGVGERSTDGGAFRLAAGEEAEVTDLDAVRVSSPNVQNAVAWRNRKLVFAGERADEIAAEFNRYNTVQIHVEGEGLRARLMGGTFDADDPKPLIRYLSREPGVEVVTTPTQIIIRPRRSEDEQR